MHDFFGAESARAACLPSPERSIQDGWEIFIGRGKDFSYKTVISGKIWKSDTSERKSLTDLLCKILSEYAGKPDTTLAAGIGNRFITADSLGPLVCSKLLTGNIGERKLSAISPGTPAQTGIDTAVLVSLAAKSQEAQAIITIDSLCASIPSRLGTVIQISDRGIIPGSALTHTSSEISRLTMPCKVVSIGVPTVFLSEDMLMTSAEIDVICDCLSSVIASSVNKTIFGR